MWFSDVVWENPNQRKEFMLTNVIFQHGLPATWKGYNMETLSSSLVLHEWNPPATSGFLQKWPVMQSSLFSLLLSRISCSGLPAIQDAMTPIWRHSVMRSWWETKHERDGSMLFFQTIPQIWRIKTEECPNLLSAPWLTICAKPMGQWTSLI